MEFQSIVSTYIAMAGVAALLAIVINILKTVGIVKDGEAPVWNVALNIVGLAALFGLKIFRPDIELEGLDQQAAALANTMTVVFTYLTQIGVTKLAHNIVKGVPVLGKTFNP